MGITKEKAAEMQRRVNELRLRDPNMVAIGLDTIEFVATNSLHTERSPKTATTIGAKAERASEAETGQPQRKKNTEYNIQKEFVQRMGQKYPDILIFSDAAAHVAKSMIQQVRANALQSKGMKWPDCFIAQPSGDYAGLFLEFKSDTPYKKDNVTLKSNPHNEAQRKTMSLLSQRGYECYFVWEVGQAMAITEKYLNQ